MGGLIRGYKQHLTVPHPGWQRTDPLDRGLVGEWRFDPATGLVVPEYSGYGYTGTVGGATVPAWVIDRYGPALRFPTNQNGQVSTNNAIHPTSFTAEIFATYTQQDANSHAAMLTCYLAANTGVEIVVNRTTKALWWAHTVAWVVNTTTFVVTPGDWFHVILAYNENTGTIVWANGNEVDTDANAGAMTFTGHWWIGAREDGWSDRWSGDIALARLYNRAVTKPEAQDRYELCLKRAQAMTHAWTIPWGMVTVLPRIPRIPAAYNTLAIY